MSEQPNSHIDKENSKLEAEKLHQAEESLVGMPKFIKSWKQAYWLLFAWLIVLIVLFYWFSEAFK